MAVHLHRIALGSLAALCVTGGFVVAMAQGGPSGTRLALAVLSSRADMVTGGDALIALSGTRQVSATVAVDVNGERLTNFKPTADGLLVGLISGLPIGNWTCLFRATAEAACVRNPERQATSIRVAALPSTIGVNARQ